MVEEKQTSSGEEIPLNPPGNAQRARPCLDMNHYATKKTAAQSMFDVALLMANASQLKTALRNGPNYQYHLIALIVVSITFQTIVGFLLIFIAKSNLNDEWKQSKLNTLNNIVTIFIFFILLVNVFITAFSSESEP